MNNSPGEWCVEYHGVGRFKSSEQAQDITRKIIVDSFKSGPNQVHSGHADINHPGKTVVDGVYCIPNHKNLRKIFWSIYSK